MRSLAKRLSTVRHFILRDMWLLDLDALSRLRRQWVSMLRVGFLVMRGYVKDRCSVEASALTYITLMSLIPCLALSFALAKAWGVENVLREQLENSRGRLNESIANVLQMLIDLVNNTNFGALGLIGGALLLWTAVRTLIKIEMTLNEIWGVRQGRSTTRRMIAYTGLLMVVPPLVVIVVAMNTALSSSALLQKAMDEFGPLVVLYHTGWRVLAFLVIAGIFAFLYGYLPNTRVRLRPALIGGLIGAGLWIIFQWACLHLQSVIFQSRPIYGAFAVLPVFLIWLWLNWSIVLFGAEITFSVQNPESYLLELNTNSTSFHTRRLLAFLMVYEICRAQSVKDGPWHVTPYQKRFNLPIRLLRQVLYQMESQQIVKETRNHGFVPARDMQQITLADIETAITGEPDERVTLALQNVTKLAGAIAKPEDEYRELLQSITLHDLVHGQADAQLDAIRDAFTISASGTIRPLDLDDGHAGA